MNTLYVLPVHFVMLTPHLSYYFPFKGKNNNSVSRNILYFLFFSFSQCVSPAVFHAPIIKFIFLQKEMKKARGQLRGGGAKGGTDNFHKNSTFFSNNSKDYTDYKQ